MSFFEGALSYKELREMPLPEISMLQGEAKRIHAQRNKK
jgi:uncharacterized small protein (DUF1192 family)